jgi:hypothetical protein
VQATALESIRLIFDAVPQEIKMRGVNDAIHSVYWPKVAVRCGRSTITQIIADRSAVKDLLMQASSVHAACQDSSDD